MRSFLHKSVTAALLLCFLPLTGSAPYPIDGYDITGIRRLVAVQRIVDGQKSGTKPPPGALKSIRAIALHLDSQERHLSVLPAADPALTKAINAIFPGLDANYSVSVLDITEGRPVRVLKNSYSGLDEPHFLQITLETKAVYPCAACSPWYLPTTGPVLSGNDDRPVLYARLPDGTDPPEPGYVREGEHMSTRHKRGC